MIRVILDTNILISSVFWEDGVAHKIVELALNRKLKVFTSFDILREFANVLKKNFKEDEVFINRQVALILEYAEVVKPLEKVNIVKEDPEDNKIIECAFASYSDYIITYDKDLLRFKEIKNIKIVKPEEILRLYK